MLRINTNVPGIDTLRMLRMNDLSVSQSLQKLSSGLRVNYASDDAAGLTISQSIRSQVRGNAQADKNIQDGISLCNVADGAMNQMQEILQRMRTLAVQSANGSLAAGDRQATDQEYQALLSEIDNVAQYTSFNGQPLFSGQAGPNTTSTVTIPGSIAGPGGTTPIALAANAISFSITSVTATSTLAGPPAPPVPPPLTSPANYTTTTSAGVPIGLTPTTNYNMTINNASLPAGGYPYNVTVTGTLTTATLSAEQFVIQDGADQGMIHTVSIPPINSTQIGVSGTNLQTQAGAMSAITAVQSAIDQISAARSQVGAAVNDLQYQRNDVVGEQENLSAANSRIMDVDMASEMTAFTRSQILETSSMQMLAIVDHSNYIGHLLS